MRQTFLVTLLIVGVFGCGVWAGTSLTDRQSLNRPIHRGKSVTSLVREGVVISHGPGAPECKVFKPFRVDVGFEKIELMSRPEGSVRVTSIVFPSEQVVVHCIDHP